MGKNFIPTYSLRRELQTLFVSYIMPRIQNANSTVTWPRWQQGLVSCHSPAFVTETRGVALDYIGDEVKGSAAA